MPQLEQAKKYLSASQKRRVFNDRWRRKMHNTLTQVRDAVAAGNKKDAETAALKAESVLDRAARQRIIHPNKAARKKSRIRQAIQKIQ